MVSKSSQVVLSTSLDKSVSQVINLPSIPIFDMLNTLLSERLILIIYASGRHSACNAESGPIYLFFMSSFDSSCMESNLAAMIFGISASILALTSFNYCILHDFIRNPIKPRRLTIAISQGIQLSPRISSLE